LLTKREFACAEQQPSASCRGCAQPGVSGLTKVPAKAPGPHHGSETGRTWMVVRHVTSGTMTHCCPRRSHPVPVHWLPA